MSTTTIRLPQDLKERIARAAERAGSTAHSFILEAIAEKAEQELLGPALSAVRRLRKSVAEHLATEGKKGAS